VVGDIPQQASCLFYCFHQRTNLVLVEWCFQVPDAVVWSSLIIDGQVKGAVIVVHFSWIVTSEFLVIMNWTTFVVCASPLQQCVLDPFPDLWIRTLLPVLLSF